MSDALEAGVLPPVQAGQGAFQDTKLEGVAPVPLQKPEPTLNDILEAVRKQNPDKPADADKPAAPDVKQDTPDKPANPAAVKPTGNRALDIAVASFVKVAGATEDDISKALTQAYEVGDVRLIDRAYLKERFGEHSEQAIALAEAVMEFEMESSQKLLADVHAIGGGEEQFGKAVALFKEHAPKGMQSVIKQMLDSNDADTVKEAASLIVEYGKSSGGLVSAKARVIGDGSAAGTEGLTYAQFTAAQKQLNPVSRTYREDFAQLVEQRRIGKQLGK